MSKEITKTDTSEIVEHGHVLRMTQLTVEQMVQFKALVEQLYHRVLKEDVDYGVIPGTPKPTLLKPGAQTLCLLFGLVPHFETRETELGNGHLEVVDICRLTLKGSEVAVAEGRGSCSTMEKRYRYRSADRACPACGKATIIKGKVEYGGGWLCYKKKGGCGEKYRDDDPAIVGQVVGQIENADIADCRNTVRKQSKKRAMVDAVLDGCAASDRFTADLEDGVVPQEELDRHAKKAAPAKPGAPAKPAEREPEGSDDGPPPDAEPQQVDLDSLLDDLAECIKRAYKRTGNPSTSDIKVIRAWFRDTYAKGHGGEDPDPRSWSPDDIGSCMAWLDDLKAPEPEKPKPGDALKHPAMEGIDPGLVRAWIRRAAMSDSKGDPAKAQFTNDWYEKQYLALQLWVAQQKMVGNLERQQAATVSILNEADKIAKKK